MGTLLVVQFYRYSIHLIWPFHPLMVSCLHVGYKCRIFAAVCTYMYRSSHELGLGVIVTDTCQYHFPRFWQCFYVLYDGWCYWSLVWSKTLYQVVANVSVKLNVPKDVWRFPKRIHHRISFEHPLCEIMTLVIDNVRLSFTYKRNGSRRFNPLCTLLTSTDT